MSTNILENIKKSAIELEKSITNSPIFEAQREFLQSNLGEVINGAIDTGLRIVLPDFIEDEILDVKNSILTEGFSEGIKTAIDNVMNFGKNLKSMFTGNFESISQLQSVIEKGGLIDSVSDLLDVAIDLAKSNKWINSSTAKAIKKGKNTIIKTIENNIDDSLNDQVTSIEKIDSYIEKWKKYYEEKDFDNMEKQYKKIENEMEKILPLKNVLEEVKNLENLHELIKNNGKNFNLSEEEINLAKILT